MKPKLLIAAAGSAALFASVAFAQGYGGSTPTPATKEAPAAQSSQQPDAASEPATGGPEESTSGYEDAGERG